MKTQEHRWARVFFVIWTGQAFSLLGSAVAQFAIVWWMTNKTGSAAVLSMAMLASTLPQGLIGPVAGVLVDRWSRKAVMIGADLLVAASSLALAAVYLHGDPNLLLVYLILAVRSICTAFHWPAMSASMPLIVPPEHLTRMAGLTQGLQSAANLIGPALGAVLLGIWHMPGIMMLDVIGAVVASFALLLVHIPVPARAAGPAGGEGFIQEMRAGFRALWQTKGLLLLVVAGALFTLLLLPVSAMFPLMSTQHFGGGTWHMGAVEVAFGAGMLAGSALLGFWGGTRRKVLTINGSLVATGTILLGMGLLPSTGFIWFLLASFVLGMCGPFFNGPLTALVQVLIEPAAQGRVFSLMGTMMILATPVGLLLAGPAADLMGVPAWFAGSGAATALVGVLCFAVPAIMRVEDGIPKASA